MNIFENNYKKEIKKRVDCQVLAESLGVRKKSKNVFFCFNHNAHNNGDKTPSLTIKTKYYKCYACCVHGDCFQLVMDVLSLEYIESVRYLMEYTGLTNDNYIFPYKPVVFSHINSIKKSNYISTCKSEQITENTVTLTPILKEVFRKIQKIIETPDYKDFEKNFGKITEFQRYLDSRGIEQTTAINEGVSEWTSLQCKNLEKYLSSLSMDIKQKTGFYSEEGKLWFPLFKKIQFDEKFNGCCIPQYIPDFDFPVSYRWRYYYPNLVGKKSWSMYGHWSIIPFGLRTLQQAKGLFIVEGEIDYLSVVQSLDTFLSINDGLPNFLYETYVVGLPTIREKRFIKNLNINQLEHVYFMLHIDRNEPEKVEQVFLDFTKDLVNQIKISKNNIHIVYVPGENDLNDRLKTGELIENIEELVV